MNLRLPNAEAIKAMLPKSLVREVTAQVFGVGAYFGLVVILYWWRLTDAGAVAIILGLLFLFKSVVDSGASSRVCRHRTRALTSGRRGWSY